MIWGEYVALTGDTKNTYKILVRNLERKTPLRRPKH
jgi:hypothetical protein